MVGFLIGDGALIFRNVSSFHGEAGEVDLKAAEHEFQKLRIEIGKYPPSNVFNMDEAGLFFKAIPNRSYIL